jgi:hypothetical protein
MKRLLALLVVVGFAFTVVGCACAPKQACPDACLQAIDAIKNRPCDEGACQAAAARAEAAAARAEAAADKCESMFMKKMKK